MAEKLATKDAGLRRNDRRAGGAKRGERFVAAVSGARAVGGDDSEMINSVRSQAADVGNHILVCVAVPTLDRSGEPVAGRRAILEINCRRQPLRIY